MVYFGCELLKVGRSRGGPGADEGCKCGYSYSNMSCDNLSMFTDFPYDIEV